MLIMHSINIKRIYLPAAEKTDGVRILVDRLWPRGVSKEHAKLDLWLKEIAPSTELRQWFHSDESGHRWKDFKEKYILELDKNPAVERLKNILAKNETVTLLYAVHDEQHNHAVILKEFVTK